MLASASAGLAAAALPSMPHTATTASRKAATPRPEVTATSRAGENGSSSWPATPAVTAKPKIIMIHTMVAAGARRGSATRLASSTSSEVPAAPTPMPIRVKATVARMAPATRSVAIQAVASAALMPPSASTAMPPMIQGVRRPPTSEP